MTTRVLFVGLGGSGGVVCSLVRARLQRILHERGWGDRPFPKNVWQFVHFDVPGRQDIVERLGKADVSGALSIGASLDEIDYVNLVDSSMTYTAIDGLIQNAYGRHELDRQALLGWREQDPRQVRVPVADGAGQLRGVGAMAALHARDKISSTIARLHDIAVDDQAMEQAAELAAFLSPDSPEEGSATDRPYVVLCSSMVGGAGAGMFGEITGVCRAYFGERVIAFLETVEGFDNIGTFAVANQWAMMGELQAAAASRSSAEGGDGVAVRRYPTAEQKNSDVSAHHGADAVFVFGSRNANGVALSADGAVERVMAESAASIAWNTRVRTDLIHYAITNKVHTDELGTLGGHSVFRSMGFASLELGRERFRQYAVDRLIGLVGRKIRSEHVRRDEDQQLSARHNEIAGSVRYELAEHCRLRNYQAGGQVIKTIRPELSSIKGVNADELLAAIGDKKMTSGQLSNAIKNDVRLVSRERYPEWLELLTANVDRWEHTVEASVTEAVVDFVAEYGLPITARSFEYLNADLEAAARELDANAQHYTDRQKVSYLSDQLDEAIVPGMRQVTDEMKRQAAVVGAASIEAAFERQLHNVAADLCRNASQRLIKPVVDRLQALEIEITGPGAEWSEILNQAPLGDSVDAYRPLPFEVMIDKLADFPKIFDRLLTETVGISRINDAVDTVTDEIIGSDRAWLDLRASWAAGDVRYLDKGRTSDQIAIAADLSSQQIRRQIETWIDRSGRAFHEYVRYGISDFIVENPDNRRRFLSAFEQVAALAAPLSDISRSLVEVVHQGSDTQPTYTLTALPIGGLDESTAAEISDSVLTILNKVGKEFQANTLPIAFDTELESIVIMSSNGPLQAMCFENIMAPIRTAWKRGKGTVGDRQRRGPAANPQDAYNVLGWQRHTVPLSMSLPLSPDAQSAFIAGMLVAKARGFVGTDHGQTNRWVEIDGHEGRKHYFPKVSYPIWKRETALSRSLEELVDIKVAYLEASAEATDWRRHMGAYLAVIEIGSSEFTMDQELKQLTDSELGELASSVADLAGHMDSLIVPRLDDYGHTSSLFLEFRIPVSRALEQVAAGIMRARRTRTTSTKIDL
ncbi:MAG: tubulin-like doman-containing protein [Acidimicrobiales bacterium]